MSICVKTSIPGPNSIKLLQELAEYESPAITAKSQIARSIVWHKTQDVFVEDVDGNRYLDFTAGFGVAVAGHAHPEMVKAAQLQMATMPHALGDVYPADTKIQLAKRLAEITPGNLKKSFFANSGAEAIEIALKTALLKTRKPGIIAFENAYHGLTYGALAVTHYRECFRQPFFPQINSYVIHLPFPDRENDFTAVLEKTLKHTSFEIGAIIIEPILGRGGIIEAPVKALQDIREVCTRHDIVMIVDEIFTGFGRTGQWFAVNDANVVPDLLCIGKGLNGGFPLAVVMGNETIMNSWEYPGEARHAATFLGNPVGCAMALKSIELLENGLLDCVTEVGTYCKNALLTLQKKFPQIVRVSGRGLMLGMELQDVDCYAFCYELLQRGIIVLTCGIGGNVLSFSPAFTIKKEHVDFLVQTLEELLICY